MVDFTTAAHPRNLDASVLLVGVASVRALRGQFDALEAVGVLRPVPDIKRERRHAAGT
jgi:hypothetical protein